MTARALAIAALAEWRRGQGFADAIIQRLLAASSLGSSDRGFATELFYGVLRNLTLLDFWIDGLRSGSLDYSSRDLLRLGLYQVFHLRTAGHAAIFETVELADRRNRSLINAVLRSAQRKFPELETAATKSPLTTRLSHPPFLIDRWTKQYGTEAVTVLCEWNNQPAPVYARINQLKISPDEFLKKYPAAETLPGRANFIRLTSIPSAALAGGECYIQDPSTELAVELLDAQPGETILDACAAPGGKSGFIAERMQNRGGLIAADRAPIRVATLRENLARLGATCAQIVRQDWKAAPPVEFEPRSFDRILVDAPCSNTGVMRRRVDVRWRLSPEDFVRMPREQIAILRAVVPLLKPGGTLVYSTCSLEWEENEGVVERALQEFPGLKCLTQKSVQPFRDGFDGAFAAHLAGPV